MCTELYSERCALCWPWVTGVPNSNAVYRRRRLMSIWYHNLLIREFIWFPDFFLDFSGFSSNLHISKLLTLFLHRIGGLILKYDIVILFSVTLSCYCLFSDFFGFFWIFLYFFRVTLNLNFFVWNKSLLCSLSRTLVFKSC